MLNIVFFFDVHPDAVSLYNKVIWEFRKTLQSDLQSNMIIRDGFIHQIRVIKHDEHAHF